MEIISIESSKGAERRLSAQHGIALTQNPADLEDVGDEILLNGLCIFYLERGKVQFTISGKEQKIESGQLVTCNYRQRISDFMFSADMKFRAFFTSVDFLLTLSSRMNLSMNIFGDMMQFNFEALKISDEEAHNICRYYDLLYSKRHASAYQQQSIDTLCEAFGYEMLDIMARHGRASHTGNPLQPSGEYSTMQQHMNRFMQLLVHTKPIEHKVNWYASQLCITPKYLNIICQQLMQQSPSTIIEREITQRALHMLRETSLSIKEISQQLGFNNQSHFGTFIRHTKGASPLQIRTGNLAKHQPD
ncbi:MAG: AraC family transcriptional regulator [Bacteroidales bacterium]|nr:AraC family transcriptional regulator [Candidatus Physcousia equi]